MNAACAPACIFVVHLEDQSTQHAFDLTGKAAALGFVSPIIKKSAPVPFDYRFRPCNAKPANRLRAKRIEPAPDEAVSGPYKRRVSFCALEDAKLMPKSDNFKL